MATNELAEHLAATQRSDEGQESRLTGRDVNSNIFIFVNGSCRFSDLQASYHDQNIGDAFVLDHPVNSKMDTDEFALDGVGTSSSAAVETVSASQSMYINGRCQVAEWLKTGSTAVPGYIALSSASHSILYNDTSMSSELARFPITWNRQTSSSSSTLTNSLVSYWTMDSDLTDAHGSNDGSNSSAELLTTGQKLGDGCYDFDGGAYVDVGTSSTLDLVEMSIVAWVKVTDSTNAGYIVMRNADDDSARLYSMYLNSNEDYILHHYRYGGSTQTESWTHTGYPIDDGAWHHVAITRTTVSAILYLDGNNQGTMSLAGIPTTSAGLSVRIGNRHPNSYQFEGHIDEVGIWSEALSEADVLDLYNSGSGWQYPFSTTSSASGKAIDGTFGVPSGTLSGSVIRSIGVFDATTGGNMFFLRNISPYTMGGYTQLSGSWQVSCSNYVPMMDGGVIEILNWICGSSASNPSHIAWGTGSETISATTFSSCEGEIQRNAAEYITRDDFTTMYNCLLELTQGTNSTITRTALFNASSGGTMFLYDATPSLDKTEYFAVQNEDVIKVR